MKCLRSRECGLYEASDFLLGDHLHEKSVPVQWVSVVMPKDRKSRLKKYSDLQQLAATDPDSENVYCVKEDSPRFVFPPTISTTFVQLF